MSARFAVGDRVRVMALHPPGHVRTPFYLRGRAGEVGRLIGPMPNAERLAYGRDGLPAVPVYRVRFAARDLWPEAAVGDDVVADLYEHWLEAVS